MPNWVVKEIERSLIDWYWILKETHSPGWLKWNMRCARYGRL